MHITNDSANEHRSAVRKYSDMLLWMIIVYLRDNTGSKKIQ